MNKSVLHNPDDAFYGDLHQILVNILNEHSTEEGDLFKELGPEALKNYVTTRDKSGARGISFEFSPLIDTGLLSVHLIVATVAVIELYAKVRTTRNEEASRSRFEEEWRRLLIEEGMPEEVARLIPVKYSLDLLDFLVKHRIGEVREASKPSSQGHQRRKTRP